ncbi:MAG: zinc-dependent metalloprotease [Chitinophagales bacterium]|nr:zinc-dependent metalloprotease [Chitinophagales bacterium]
MKSLYILPVLLWALTLSAQQQPHQHTNECKYDQLQKAFEQNEPQAYQLYLQVLQATLDRLEEEREQRDTAPTQDCPNGVKIIPLYFHIMHNGGSPTAPGNNNFTVAEISAAVDNLNKHFAGNNYNLERVPDEFWEKKTVAANTCIQFCWNTSDITRVNVAQAPYVHTMFDASGAIKEQEDIKASPLKNTCEYLNVYTGNYGFGLTTGGLLGYAYNLFSSSASVHIDDNTFVPFGPLTNHADTNATSFPHEVAHFLGLSHVWGPYNITDSMWTILNTNATLFCSVDDGIYDTPLSGRPCDGSGPGVPQLVQNASATHCSGVRVMWTNFMDYTRRDWRVNFSKGQALFMRYYMEYAKAVFSNTSGCTSAANFLNGETRCTGAAINCNTAPSTAPTAILNLCNSDTVNLLRYQHNWGYNTAKSPATEYTWRKNSLTGTVVEFPAKEPVYRKGTICKPDTTVYFLNMKCALTGTEQLAGKVTVLAYSTPEQLVKKYLRNGDCQYGPKPGFTATDSAAGCHQLVSFTQQNNPAFPTTVSGSIRYTVTFDPQVLGPCCTNNCTRYDTAYYYCHVPVNSCPGVAVSGGINAMELSPCPDLNFNTLYNGYENNLVSIFDPQNNINSFYYFSDVLRTVPFNPATDYVYNGNGCDEGSDVVIYTALGCDTDHDNVPNTYITLGSITLMQPAAPARAPTLSYTINSSQDCVYKINKACSSDNVTPSPIPIAVCGTTNMPPVTFSVLTSSGCTGTFVVAKPDCPNCTVTNCVTSGFTGGAETICSGERLSSGLPAITITASSGPVINLFWATLPLNQGGGTIYPQLSDDLPEWKGPVFTHSNPASGAPETQTLYAYAMCDDDNNPATPPVYTLLGQYVVTINPVPNGRMVPVCHNDDSLQYFIEIQLFTHHAGNSYTATNSFNASTLTFNAAGTKQFGPFPNGVDVSVHFETTGGCALEETFNKSCLSSSCTNPEIAFDKICLNNNSSEYFVDVSITGNTNGYLYEVTNNLNSDTNYISMQEPTVRLGAYPSQNIVDVKVVDYSQRTCFTQSGPLTQACTFLSVSDFTNKVLIYPNPATDFITVRFPNTTAGNYHVSVYDVLGRKVSDVREILESADKELRISLEDITPGVYFLRVLNDNNQNEKIIRFVKQ